MTARCNPAEQAALGVDRQLSLFCFAEPLRGEVFGPGEQESGEPKRERRLANAARPAQQDRVRQPPRLDEPAQLALGILVSNELRVLPRCEHAGRRASRRLYRHCLSRTCRRAELVRRMRLKPVTQSRIQPRLPAFPSRTKFFNDIPRQPYRNPQFCRGFLLGPSSEGELLNEGW